ncbi:MAG TPA: GNAT family N-acetyltransferase, partial [Coleofasciculaceae cyanobacterium]
PAAIADLVDRLWTADTLLWWVFVAAESQPIAGLWLGWAIDPNTGARRAQLFWLSVRPAYRRQGIATALMRVAEAAARQAGCDRLGLQVDAHNPAAIGLYQSLGYVTRSLELVKSLDP